MENNNYVLECRHVTKRYGGLTVLDDLSLNLARGRIIGLLGPNGSGKTTLIKLINGLLAPTSGEIAINGEEPSPETKAHVSYLPDNMYLASWMNIDRIIRFYADFYEDFDKNKAYEMLSRLNLNPKQKFKTMSKGMKEKVQLVLVMSRSADLYCLDEPIGGVDPASRDYILNTIITNYNENAAVLISTHLIADIEMVLDDAVFLHEGKVKLYSSVEEIRNSYGMSVDAYFREEFKC